MKIELTNIEKAELKHYHRKIKDGKKRDRIKSILLINEGYSVTEISRILLIEENTVRNWKKRFIERKEESLEKWVLDNYKGYAWKLTKEEITLVKEYVEGRIISDSKEVINFIEEKYSKSYKSSGIVDLLHRLGFVYKQTVLIPSKYDSESQKAFKAIYESMQEEQKAEEAVIFMDGVHPQHNTSCTKAWIKKGQKKEVKTNTGRSRVNINGIYNPKTQEILYHEEETINAEAVIKFLEEIEEHYKEKRKIKIIVDNAKYYKNQAVKKYLEDSRIEFIFLPPYSPNLNLIERLWKLMRKKVINNRYYEKFKDFREAVLGFFENSEKFRDEIRQFVGTKLHLLVPG
jgi:transposase